MRWWEYAVWIACLLLSSVLFYRIGARRSRREVVHTFQEILIRIYQLVWSGQSEELHKFLSEVTGEDFGDYDPKIVRHNKKGKGYNE